MWKVIKFDKGKPTRCEINKPQTLMMIELVVNVLSHIGLQLNKNGSQIEVNMITIRICSDGCVTLCQTMFDVSYIIPRALSWIAFL